MTKMNHIASWLKRHRKAIAIISLVVLGLIVAAQMLYPRDRLLPYVVVDGVSVGGWQKQDAVKMLDQRYQQQPVSLFFGDNQTASFTTKPTNIGLTVDNQARLNTSHYPWYMRLIPSSALWYGRVRDQVAKPNYSHNREAAEQYVNSTLGSSCDVKPVNASLKVKTGTVEVIPSSKGGTCEAEDVVDALLSAEPVITTETTVRIAMQEIAPTIDDSEAASLADTLNERLKSDGVLLVAGSKTITIPSDTIASWLVFTNKGSEIKVAINPKKATSVLNEKIAPSVALAAGTTYITTMDFRVVSQKTGVNGSTIDMSKTQEAIVAYLTGKIQSIKTATKPVAPRTIYTRKYSKTDTGISALFANFAKDHPGTYGVQYIELSGQRRRASHNADRQFVTASTYKLFVAYSTLRRVEAGTWKWTDKIVGNKDMAQCFDDMIVLSDNACAEALEHRVGNVNLTNEAHAIGCTHTTFLEENIKSTPSDEALLLASLQSGQLLDKQSSRDRLIGAMKRNIYRQGIPSGSNGTVADKVGFLWKLLHDAAIVYSPNGTYVLVIMTDGSSWSHIADLTRQLEKLRA